MASDDRVLRGAITSYLERVHEDLDAQSPRLVADLAGVVKAERQVWRDGHITAFTRLVAAIRQLDEAMSLSDVLKALSKGAMSEASRVALLLLDGDQLRVWGQFGFGDATLPGAVALGRRGPFDTALETRQPVPLSGGHDLGSGTSFLRLPAGQAALIVPLVVGERVVALLYADGLERRLEIEEAPVWTEQVEILVRHAAQRLENLTTLRTVEVLTESA